MERVENDLTQEMLNALKGIVWKLSHNWDDGKPARIDRRDATIRNAVDLIAKAEGRPA